MHPKQTRCCHHWHALCVPPLATEPSRRLLHLFGTVCRSQYGHRRHCKFFAADWAFCPVVQLFWLRASHCTDYHVTSLLFLRVTCPCNLRTYATLKFIRSSSSSSSWHSHGGSSPGSFDEYRTAPGISRSVHRASRLEPFITVTQYAVKIIRSSNKGLKAELIWLVGYIQRWFTCSHQNYELNPA